MASIIDLLCSFENKIESAKISLLFTQYWYVEFIKMKTLFEIKETQSIGF